MFCFRKGEYISLATDSTRSMCKTCQSCFETVYWHLIDKRFCYDESIALYEEPPPTREKEKNNNMFDNMAFYDSVSVIAGRAVVTIDPLPPKPVENEIIIVKQPTKSKVRFDSKDIGIIPSLETNETADNKTNEEKLQRQISAPNIVVENNDTRIENINSEDDNVFTTIQPSTEVKTVDESDAKDTSVKIQNNRVAKLINNNLPCHSSLPDLVERAERQTDKQNNLLLPDQPKERKKSLRERRQSKCASLNFEHILRGDLPMIKQNSMPKFYLDTPDVTIRDSPIIRNPSYTLSSPVVPNANQFLYDLKSIVELQKQMQSSSVSLSQEPVKKSNPSIARIMGRIPSLKKHASTHSLPNTTHHI